jgi:two-component system sensor histidine kinase BarA
LDGKQVVLDPAPFILRDVVDGVVHSMASVAQNKGLDICLLNSLDHDPPVLLADGFRVKQVCLERPIPELTVQVLLNFLSNAIKFTAAGKVTIEWKWEVRNDVVDICIDVADTVSGFVAHPKHG